MNKLTKRIKEHFKEEDRIISKAMNKLTFLMISRGIDHSDERKELVNLRNKLLEELEKNNNE